MTAKEAIRKFCIECCGGQMNDTRKCGGDKCINGGCEPNGICYFYKFRLNRGRPSVRLIRKMCLWCMGGSSDLVRDCIREDCPAYNFRFGKNPNVTEETKEKRRIRAKKLGLSPPLHRHSSR